MLNKIMTPAEIEERIQAAQLLGSDEVLMPMSFVREIQRKSYLLSNDLIDLVEHVRHNDFDRWPRIHMIKIYRSATGAGLRESKDAVETAIDQYERRRNGLHKSD